MDWKEKCKETYYYSSLSNLRSIVNLRPFYLKAAYYCGVETSWKTPQRPRILQTISPGHNFYRCNFDKRLYVVHMGVVLIHSSLSKFPHHIFINTQVQSPRHCAETPETDPHKDATAGDAMAPYIART